MVVGPSLFRNSYSKELNETMLVTIKTYLHRKIRHLKYTQSLYVPENACIQNICDF